MEPSGKNSESTRVVHFGVWFVSDDPVHLRNLYDPRMLSYPDGLGQPVLCLRDSPENRWVPPTFINLAIYAGRITNAEPRRKLSELLARLREGGPVWAAAAAWRDIPVVPENIWVKFLRWFRQVPVPAVDQQQLIEKMAEAIADVFTQAAKCIDAPEPPDDAVQILASGGVPMDLRRNRMTPESWYVKNSALERAKAKLTQRDLVFPKGAEHDLVVAPIFGTSSLPGFVRIEVIRIFPCKDMKARDFLAPNPDAQPALGPQSVALLDAPRNGCKPGRPRSVRVDSKHG